MTDNNELTPLEMAEGNYSGCMADLDDLLEAITSRWVNIPYGLRKYVHMNYPSQCPNELGEPDFETLAYMVQEWANDKGILDKATPASQFEKTMEEVGELARGLIEQDPELVIDAIGDVIVTLIILATLQGLDITKCLNCAYEEIADRKGKMINGVFVKDK
jgi:NTP pyrophosphatase (non-canonical NTP hydrolase)